MSGLVSGYLQYFLFSRKANLGIDLCWVRSWNGWESVSWTSSPSKGGGIGREALEESEEGDTDEMDIIAELEKTHIDKKRDN